MLQLVLFIIGFALVIKGADLLIDGSAFLAKRLKVSQMAIGLTIVAFGTSLPELVVNISASLRNASQLALGNVFGSNIANILLVVGVTSIVCKIPIKKKTLKIDIPYTLGATLLVGLLANTSLFGNEGLLMLNRYEGIVLLFFFILYLIYIAKTARDLEEIIPGKKEAELSIVKSLTFIFLGIIGLFVGGQWIVNGAGYLTKILGVTEGFVGLTIVAFGTSVPELATSLIAGGKGNLDIAVGNIVGSNVFNLLWVLAVSSVIKPIPFISVYNFDIIVILLATVLLLVNVYLSKAKTIGRGNGIFFLIVYLSYLFYIYFRG